MSFEGQDRSSASYRPEIDGLRAVAVLAVIAFHAKVPGFAGGFLGVDIFFVISGYLITDVIMRQMNNGSFSLRRFYLSRARRILPALFLVIGICSILSLLLPLPEQTQDFGEFALAAMAFVANIAAWKTGQGYFDKTADDQPLIHLWSLSVEEQFYLIYPFFLVAVLWWGRTRVVLLMSMIMVVSLTLAEWASEHAPSAAYYLLPTRAWEILAGCMLGYRQAASGRLAGGNAVSAILAWGGLALIAASFLWVRSTGHIPGLGAVPTVTGALLILAFSRPDASPGKLLASRPLQFIGLISYSLFLWHQPALAFLRLLPLNAPGPAGTAAAIGGTFVLSVLTWRWVESPFRDSRTLPASKAIIHLATAAAILGGTAALLSATNGLPERLPRRAIALEELARSHRARQLACYIGEDYGRSASRPCLLGRRGPVTVALIGDSHAAALAPGLKALLQNRESRALLLARSSCPPLVRFQEFDPVHQAGCAAARAQVFRALASDPRIDTVIVAARWTFYLERDFPDNGEGGRASGPDIPKPSLTENESFARELENTVRALLARHKKVVIVYPIPEAGWDVPLYLAKAEMRGTSRTNLSVSSHWVRQRNAEATAMLDRLGQRPGLYRIRPAEKLCGRERCSVALNGEPLYFDSDHPTAAAAVRIMQSFDHIL